MLGSGVRISYAPPNPRNPNLIPVGDGFGFLLFIREIEDIQKAALQEKTGFRNLWTVFQATDAKIRACRGISEPLPVRQTIKITKPICQNLEEWDSGFLYAARIKLR